MKILESILFLQVLAIAKLCNANDFGANTCEFVFLNNPYKDIKGTYKVSGNFKSSVIKRFLTISSVS